MKEEIIIKSGKELTTYLKEKGFSRLAIFDIYYHERIHINKARELGYNFSHYKIYFSDSPLRIEVSPIFDKVSDLKDRTEIALAPENPSVQDIGTAVHAEFYLTFHEFINSIIKAKKQHKSLKTNFSFSYN